MKKIKQILALLLAILLGGLYLFTLIVSFFQGSVSSGLLQACIYCTVAVPVLIYAYMLIYRVLKKSPTDSDISKEKRLKSTDTNNSLSDETAISKDTTTSEDTGVDIGGK